MSGLRDTPTHSAQPHGWYRLLRRAIIILSCFLLGLLKFTLVVVSDTTLHDMQSHTIAFSPSVLIKCCICSYYRSRQLVTFYHHVGVTLVDVACLVTRRSGGAEFGIVARLMLCVEQLALGSAATGPLGGQAKETVKFVGTLLFVESARVKRRRSIGLKLFTKFTNLAVTRFWNDDDDGARCDTTSERGFHVESSSCRSIWTCRCSACHQQSRHSSRKEGYSESH